MNSFHLRIAFAILQLLTGLMPAQPAQSESPHLTAFVNVNVVPMDRDRVVPNQMVLVEDGKIKAIGPSVHLRAGARVIDGRGSAFLSPGLADMHTHSDTAEDLMVYLANGVTTVLNMGGARTGFVDRERRKVNRGEIPGPHVYVSFLVDGTPQYGGFVVTTPDEARALVRLAKTNGYDFIKVYNNLSAECFYALVEEGRIQHVPVIGHGVTQVGLARQIEAGQLLVAHTEEFFYTFFNAPVPDDPSNPPSAAKVPAAIELVKRNGAFVTADLNTFATIALQWGRPAVVDGFMQVPEIRYLSPRFRIAWRQEDYEQRKGSMDTHLAFLKAFTRDMAIADVPLVTGTDAPAIPGLVPGFSLHQDLRALEQAGLTRYQVLSAATRIPGEFIHKAKPDDEPFGTVTVGNRADLILSAKNPLDGLTTLQKPVGVMANGVWYDAGDLQSLLDKVEKTYEMH
jgi:hypothetical protein